MNIELLHVISDISIYKIYVIKLVIYYHNSNILGSGGKNVHLTHVFSLIKKKKKKKNLTFEGLSMLGGLGP